MKRVRICSCDLVHPDRCELHNYSDDYEEGREQSVPRSHFGNVEVHRMPSSLSANSSPASSTAASTLTVEDALETPRYPRQHSFIVDMNNSPQYDLRKKPTTPLTVRRMKAAAEESSAASKKPSNGVLPQREPPPHPPPQTTQGNDNTDGKKAEAAKPSFDGSLPHLPPSSGDAKPYFPARSPAWKEKAGVGGGGMNRYARRAIIKRFFKIGKEF